jgi:peptidoglycan hydrolase CwlO-like protein
MMDIVQPTAEDISLEEAAAMARVSTKTVRRATGSGLLPRTYVISPRGPRLVFQRDALDRWLATRHRKPREATPQDRARPGAQDRSWRELRESVAAFQATLESSRQVVARLAAQLQQPDGSAAQAQAALTRLHETLDVVNRRIQDQVAALPARPESAPADQAVGPT